MAQWKVQLNNRAVLEPLKYNAELHFDPNGLAKSLSFICRFAGNTRVFYSDAQHSLLVSNIAGAIALEKRKLGFDKNIDFFEVSMMGLLHEAVEQAIGDIPGPVKNLPAMCFVKGAEHQSLKGLYEFHGLKTNLEQLRIIEEADKYALSREAWEFMYPDPVWDGLFEKYPPASFLQFSLTEDSGDFEKWQNLWIERYEELLIKLRTIKDA